MRLVCFCGMDGCGKSTQCRILAERLRKLGVEVEVIHILTKGNTVSSIVQGMPAFRMFHEKLKELPNHGFRGGIKLAIGLISFFVDSWMTYIQHRLKHNRKIVIYDRFFYDQFVIFASTFSRTPWWIINLARFLPKSDIVMVMEVSPETGNMRKPEDSVEKLTKALKFYRLLAFILKVEIIDGSRDVDWIADQVYQKSVKLITDFETNTI